MRHDIFQRFAMQNHMTFCQFCENSYADYNSHLTSRIHRRKYEEYIKNSQISETPAQARNSTVDNSPYIYYQNSISTHPKVLNSIVVDEIIPDEVVSLCMHVVNSKEEEFYAFKHNWTIRVVEKDTSFAVTLQCSLRIQLVVQVSVLDSADLIAKFSRAVDLQPGQAISISELREDVGDLRQDGQYTVRVLLTRVNKEGQEPLDIDSHCTKEARALLQWMMKYSLPEKCVADVLLIIHSIGFQIKNTPRSLYQLKKWSRVALPSLAQYTSVDRDGERFWYYKPQDVARVMLSDPEYTKDWHYRYNEGLVVHQMNSRGCKEIQQMVQHHVDKGAELLLPQIFYDDYSVSQFSSIACDDLLMNFANADIDTQQDRSRKYLICSMTANKWDILRTVLLPFIEELERGTFESFFAPLKRHVKFAGSMHAFIGDYMGHCEMSGLIGPKSRLPSRLTLNEREDLPLDKLPWRDPIETYDDLREMEASALIGTKKRAKELRSAHGLLDINEMSPLWQLPILRSNFFKRFAPCLLHNEVLGNLLRHLNLLGEIMGEANILTVNERVKSYPSWAGAAPVDDMYSIVISKTTKNKEIKVVYTTGPKLQTLYQVATVVMKGIISDTHLNLLSLHVTMMQRLHLQEWSSTDISKLAADIKALRTRLREAFGDDCWQTPKFESLAAWPEFITFLGPPYLLSTQTWEVAHQQSRKAYKLTNRQVIARDLLKKVTKCTLAKHHMQFKSADAQRSYEEMVRQMQPKKHHQYDYKIIGRTATCLNPTLISLLKETAKALKVKLSTSPAVVNVCSGFYFDKSIVRPTHAISYQSPLSEVVNYGQIQHVYAIRFGSKHDNEEVWLHIKPFVPVEEDAATNLVLKPRSAQLIPMGAREFTLISSEHIVKDFVSENYVLNYNCLLYLNKAV